MENIARVAPLGGMSTWKANDIRRKKVRKKNDGSRTWNGFNTLARLADETHLALTETDQPFRFCIYRKANDVMMDVAPLAATDGRVHSRAITHDPFENVVRRIHNRMGLILDYRV
ncbi:MAG: hypothetical protein MI802_06300 [Desulfobacterales bacterium]|nr:hypothetical protein [Desulfobacterales bacterium]